MRSKFEWTKEADEPKITLYHLTPQNMRLLSEVFRFCLIENYVDITGEHVAFHVSAFKNCQMLQVTMDNEEVYFFYYPLGINEDTLCAYKRKHGLRALLSHAFLIAYAGSTASPLTRTAEFLKNATTHNMPPSVYALIWSNEENR
jgi:hypothetical protein